MIFWKFCGNMAPWDESCICGSLCWWFGNWRTCRCEPPICPAHICMHPSYDMQPLHDMSWHVNFINRCGTMQNCFIHLVITGSNKGQGVFGTGFVCIFSKPLVPHAAASFAAACPPKCVGLSSKTSRITAQFWWCRRAGVATTISQVFDNITKSILTLLTAFRSSTGSFWTIKNGSLREKGNSN